MQSINNFFVSGGAFMIPLALLSLFSLCVIAERLISSYFWNKHFRAFVLYVMSQGKDGTIMPNKKIDPYIFTLPHTQQKPLVEELFRSVFDARARNYELLGIVGSSAPLLGFIGTVSGMISSFQAIANADKVSIKLVASGISEALITTGFGLIIAVICILSESLGRYLLTNLAHKTEFQVDMVFAHAPNEEQTTDISTEQNDVAPAVDKE